jgi:hypothetical protein
VDGSWKWTTHKSEEELRANNAWVKQGRFKTKKERKDAVIFVTKQDYSNCADKTECIDHAIGLLKAKKMMVYTL